MLGLAPVSCFPALDYGFLFSRAWFGTICLFPALDCGFLLSCAQRQLPIFPSFNASFLLSRAWYLFRTLSRPRIGSYWYIHLFWLTRGDYFDYGCILKILVNWEVQWNFCWNHIGLCWCYWQVLFVFFSMQSKRRTKTAMKSTNPKWNQTFVYPCRPQKVRDIVLWLITSYS